MKITRHTETLQCQQLRSTPQISPAREKLQDENKTEII